MLGRFQSGHPELLESFYEIGSFRTFADMS